MFSLRLPLSALATLLALAPAARANGAQDIRTVLDAQVAA